MPLQHVFLISLWLKTAHDGRKRSSSESEDDTHGNGQGRTPRRRRMKFTTILTDPTRIRRRPSITDDLR